MATEKKKTKSTKGPQPKAPQDRKRKKDKMPRPEDTPGFNLLKPFDEVPVWDQGPLLELVAELQGDAEDGTDIELSQADIVKFLGPIAKALLPMARDEEEFTKFASGKKGAENVMNLAFAWMAALGEGGSSGNN